MTDSDIKKLEAELYQHIDPDSLVPHTKDAEEDISAIQDGIAINNFHFNDTFTCLPTNKNGVLYPEFWRYYKMPWLPIFYDWDDPYNDLISIYWGPRGGGKTISGVSTNIIDGQMKGIPCVSNVPFSWVAKDSNNHLYLIKSEEFDQEKFAYGDMNLKYKRLLVDEGNYLADRLRSTSNKNLAMTDILQQARKFRMCVNFCTINWMWLDPRVTGSLCDLLIECNDLFYRPFGKRAGLKKGYRLAWDIMDQSGKMTGQQFNSVGSLTFNARYMWFTYNTENFVDPREARKRLKAEKKMITDEYGQQITQEDWIKRLTKNLYSLAEAQGVWKSSDLWATLGIHDQGLRIKAGSYMRNQLGIEKQTKRNGRSSYDLLGLLE